MLMLASVGGGSHVRHSEEGVEWMYGMHGSRILTKLRQRNIE